MRLTADILLQKSEQFLNPIKERELRLRGFKISAIENLAVLQVSTKLSGLSYGKVVIKINEACFYLM